MKISPSRLLAKRALQIQRGAARAAVLGANDGLVSVLCLVLAAYGAGAGSGNILLAGFAGLIAGAVSMAAGEWISVRAQVELFEGVLKDIRRLSASDRDELEHQLADSMTKEGQSAYLARRAAAEVAEHDDDLTRAYAGRVMGFNPQELGSPWRAVVSSFVLFTVGALVPLLPWFFGKDQTALWFSISLTAFASLIVGGYIAISSGKPVAGGAVRQLMIVVLASVVTYGIGYVFGVSVA